MQTTGTFLKICLAAAEWSWAHPFLVPHKEDGRRACGAFMISLKQSSLHKGEKTRKDVA